MLGTAEGRQEQQASLGGAYHLCSVMELQVSYEVTLTMILVEGKYALCKDKLSTI